MDEIRIEELEIYAYHGVFPEENKNGQSFFINTILYTDTRKAGLNDDLTLSTHYGDVAHFIDSFMKEHTYHLIEAAAERMAEAVLLNFPLVYSLDLEIRKPQAPIGLPFSSVSVKINRGWHRAYVALGSNLGEKENHIRQAIKQIGDRKGIRNVRVSDLVRTTPYGGVEQPDFLNGAIAFETLMTPEELLVFLQELEQFAERKRKVRWGTRTLDLDIIFYEDIIMDNEKLTIPHPDVQNRDFVIKPLAQLSPYLRHPVLQKTMVHMLKDIKETHIIEGLSNSPPSK